MSRKIQYICLTLVSILLTVAQTKAIGISLKGQLNDLGDRLAVALEVQGDLAYIAMRDTSVHILDISDPENPELRGIYRCRGMMSNIIGLRAHGDHLYVTGRFLKIVDCSDLENPTEVGSYYLEGGYGYKPAVSDTFAIIPATDGTEFFFLDIYNPADPSLIFRQSGSYASRAVAMGDEFFYLALTNWNDPGIKVYSRRSMYRITAYVHLPSSFDLELYRDELLVLSSDGLRTFDVSNPQPALISRVEIPGAFALNFSGRFANVLTSFGQFLAIDVSDPDTAYIIGECVLPKNGIDVSSRSEYAFVADRWFGTRIIKTEENGTPREVGAYDLASRYQGVAVSGETVFTAIRSGVRAMDVSQQDSISLLGNLDTPGDARAITLHDTMAFVSLGDSGFCLISIANPREMRLIDHLRSEGYTNSIEIRDGLIFVAAGESGLLIYQLSEQGNIEEVGAIDLEGSLLNLCIDGNIIFTAEGSAGISIIDVGNPDDPRILSRLDTPGSAMDVTLDQADLYVADGNDYVQIVNVSDLEAPRITGDLYAYGETMSVIVQGDYLYCATSYNVRVLWLGGPRQYYDVGRYSLPLFLPASVSALPVSIAVDSNKVYCANWSRFFVFDCAEGLGIASDNHPLTPDRIEVSAFPNPFNSSVTISFSAGGQASLPVKLAIYDINGRLVADLFSGKITPAIAGGASRTVTWDASSVGAGVYFVRLEAGAEVRTQKIILMR